MIMQKMFEKLKTQNPEQALRRAIVNFGKSPEITLERIKALIALANVDAPDDNPASKKTALHLAVTHEKPELVLELLLANARYDIEDASGKTALCYAAKAKNETLKKHIFSSLATDTMAKISAEFQFVSDKERLSGKNSIEFDRISKNISKDQNTLNDGSINYIFALLTADTVERSVSQAELERHNNATAKVRKIFQYLSWSNAVRENFYANNFRINYCGLMVWRFY